MTRPIVLCLVLVVIAAPSATLVQADDSNGVLNLGDPAPAWTNLPGVDGKKHSLADLKDKQVVVVVFTCNSCPIASDYEDRIIAFAKKPRPAADKPTAIVAINVNTVEEDRLPKMKERAESKGLPLSLSVRSDAEDRQGLRGHLHAGILRARQGPQDRLHGRFRRQHRIEQGEAAISQAGRRGRSERRKAEPRQNERGRLPDSLRTSPSA